MSNALQTPWTGCATVPPPGTPTSFARLAAPVGTPAASGASSLQCPWSSTGLPVPARHLVSCLPTLGPTLPAQRAAAEPAVVAAG